MAATTTPLQQGKVSARPRRGHSQAHRGIQPLNPLRAKTERFQPLPTPLGSPPYHYDLKNAIPDIDDLAKKAGKLVLHTVGDVGGIKHPEYQVNVASAMKRDLYNLPDADKPLLFFLLGDVVYYNGEYADYYDQFYEPYDHYDAPILAIPGNHDGDAVPGDTSLDGWVKYFMTANPHVDPGSRDAPRVTLSLPNVYYTTLAPFATIVGMYTNVPEHGSVDSQQVQWLTNELATAPKDKALIVALHHPVFSFDDHHSGSANMADVLQHAINDTKRVPNMVLTAHVHNYQRIEKEIIKGGVTPFFVSGNGGYYHLHNLTAGNGDVDPENGATLQYGNDKDHGYMTLSIDKDKISGTATFIDKNGDIQQQNDSFEYPAKALFLDKNQTISLGA